MDWGVILHKGHHTRTPASFDCSIEYVDIGVGGVSIALYFFITGYYNQIRTPSNLNSTPDHNADIITVLIGLYKLRIPLLRSRTPGPFALTSFTPFNAKFVGEYNQCPLPYASVYSS
jgi:hypothetical protein